MRTKQGIASKVVKMVPWVMVWECGQMQTQVNQSSRDKSNRRPKQKTTWSNPTSHETQKSYATYSSPSFLYVEFFLMS